MPHKNPSPASQNGQKRPRAVIPNIFGVYRSLLADSIIYVLVLYAMTTVVILYLQILVGPAKAIPGLGIRPSLEEALDAGLWALTARPSLVLADWVVRRRIPAHTTRLTGCTVYEVQDMPKRWFFELLCSLANRNHYIISDPELCFRWVPYSLGIAGREPSSWKLGAVLSREQEQLRVFARKFRELSDRYSERWSESYSGPWLPPIPIGLHLIEATHYLCAEEILRHAQARPDDEKQVNANERTVAKDKKDAETETSPSVVRFDQLYADCCLFAKMYVAYLAYPLLRLVGDIVAAFGPLPENSFSFEEWCDLYVHPVAETGSIAKLRDNSPQECLP